MCVMGSCCVSWCLLGVGQCLAGHGRRRTVDWLGAGSGSAGATGDTAHCAIIYMDTNLFSIFEVQEKEAYLWQRVKHRD